MPTIYSRATDDADNDLEFKLRRSLQLVKEQKMAKVKRATGEPTKLEQHRAAIKAAMPDVEAAAKTHGLSIVNACVSKIYERNKLKKKAEALRKEIQEIEEKM